MKYLAMFLITFFSFTAFSSECAQNEVLMDVEESYQCINESTGKKTCVNFGAFVFEAKNVLRVFSAEDKRFDLAIFFNSTSLGKCWLGACEWTENQESSIKARRKTIPVALLKSSDVRFNLNKEKKAAELVKEYFDDEGELSEVELTKFRECQISK